MKLSTVDMIVLEELFRNGRQAIASKNYNARQTYAVLDKLETVGFVQSMINPRPEEQRLYEITTLGIRAWREQQTHNHSGAR